VDPGALVSTPDETFEARRAVLVARAAAEREALARQFAAPMSLGDGLGWLRGMKPRLPTIALGAGLGISALLLALPVGRFPLVRGGVAVLSLAGSVRRLLSRR
jgi:hypothetical protein